MSFKDFVKDALMIVFFFSVGMQLKLDMAAEISAQKKQILLPILAAAGGMLAPALIYVGINWNHPGNHNGWAIPTATDIAFAVAVLLMVGSSLPRAAKTYLLAIAIFDDLGAIVIIALFYSGSINFAALGWALVGVLALHILNRKDVPNKTPYILIGAYLAFALHASGIHATIAGVLTGIFLPINHPTNQARSPLKEMLDAVSPWVSFAILPLFAFVSAGIPLEGLSLASLLDPITLGVLLGLFFGKQIGILGATYLLVKSKFLSMPRDTTFKQLYGVSVIAGIGFTMSLFVSQLAFADTAKQNDVTLGILLASILASVWGYIYLHASVKHLRNKG